MNKKRCTYPQTLSDTAESSFTLLSLTVPSIYSGSSRSSLPCRTTVVNIDSHVRVTCIILWSNKYVQSIRSSWDQKTTTRKRNMGIPFLLTAIVIRVQLVETEIWGDFYGGFKYFEQLYMNIVCPESHYLNFCTDNNIKHFISSP